jgi:RND superfamily putative drug exporter
MVAESTMLLVDSRSMRTAGLGMMLVTVAAVLAALVGAPLLLRALGPRLLRPADDEAAGPLADRCDRCAGGALPAGTGPEPAR